MPLGSSIVRPDSSECGIFYVKYHNMVTKTISRNAQRVALLQEWWEAKSKTFSMLAGEEFTHGEVVIAHVVLVAVLALVGIGGAL